VTPSFPKEENIFSQQNSDIKQTNVPLQKKRKEKRNTCKRLLNTPVTYSST